jgi:phospholipase/carboxylesterase
MYTSEREHAVTGIGRRTFLGLAGVAMALVAVPGCGMGAGRENGGGPEDPETMARRHAKGRLGARPGIVTGGTSGPRLEPLGIGSERDGVVYSPASYRPGDPFPLILSLHGAGGSARRGLPRLQSLADKHGFLILAPDSRGRTWDVVLGGYGPDVAFIDTALAFTFSRYSVDPTRLGVEGFSDGASYALGLGLSNGHLFNHILAFSPGFLSVIDREGSPRIFVSHGTVDSILPIDQCSRRIVPELQGQKYDVEYVEFEGDHEVPPEIASRGARWFLDTPAS